LQFLDDGFLQDIPWLLDCGLIPFQWACEESVGLAYGFLGEDLVWVHFPSSYNLFNLRVSILLTLVLGFMLKLAAR
jgi:hypothetical protein